MPQPTKKITLEPEVIEFLKRHSLITTKPGEGDMFTLPNWTLRHMELNDFEVIDGSKERFFYVSYNGLDPMDNKTVIGHLAFSHIGFPSMIYLTEVLLPAQSKMPLVDTVLSFLYEFKSEKDFDDFTIGRNMNDQMDDIIRQN